ncbi:MAG: hypothetical protein LBV57_00690 [Candidatus Symbiothrix sp.]|jgi:hypothetical protein|nr:hypothetical protein [Candidatus Symbiothrix sp.]
MKINSCFFRLLAILFLFGSCNQDEGLGGSSAIEGYVYMINHPDDIYSFQTDTFPALDKDVYLEFGNDKSIGAKTKSGREGYYRFDYLRDGTYTVYALSDMKDHKTAIATTVKVNGNSHRADTLYIHTGDAVESAMVKGRVWIQFYHNGEAEPEKLIPAVETRVFIKYPQDSTYFDDVRVGNQGIFIFQKIKPHQPYEVYVSTEEIGYKNILFPVDPKTVEVGDPYKIYPLEGEEPLDFTIKINY